MDREEWGGIRGNRQINMSSPHCPRCGSSNTKFCYYNNYSLTQPRYFCKGCRRYWTKGGSLRNVPVGGGCRKSRRANHKASSSSLRSGARLAMSSDAILKSSEMSSTSTIDLALVYANFVNPKPVTKNYIEDHHHPPVPAQAPAPARRLAELPADDHDTIDQYYHGEGDHHQLSADTPAAAFDIPSMSRAHNKDSAGTATTASGCLLSSTLDLSSGLSSDQFYPASQDPDQGDHHQFTVLHQKSQHDHELFHLNTHPSSHGHASASNGPLDILLPPLPGEEQVAANMELLQGSFILCHHHEVPLWESTTTSSDHLIIGSTTTSSDHLIGTATTCATTSSALLSSAIRIEQENQLETEANHLISTLLNTNYCWSPVDFTAYGTNIVPPSSTSTTTAPPSCSAPTTTAAAAAVAAGRQHHLP